MVNGNVLKGHSLLQLRLTPDQIFWGLGFNIRIKLRKKLSAWACLSSHRKQGSLVGFNNWEVPVNCLNVLFASRIDTQRW